MNHDRTLAAVSTVQLLSGLAGLRIAVRRRLPSNPVLVHLPFPTSHMLRDSFFLATARSAPGVVMVAQAAATASLLRRPNPRARKTLGVLGAVMTFGWLVERDSPLWPGHTHRTDTPLYALGLVGAVVMARLGLARAGVGDDPHR